VLLLAPPYIVGDGEIEMIVGRLGAATDEALLGVRSSGVNP
jgi:hypothetical protein